MLNILKRKVYGRARHAPRVPDRQVVATPKNLAYIKTRYALAFSASFAP